MATKEIQFDGNKFQELVLYIAARSESDPTFGATKLNKLLFFADFLFFARYGRPITGATYVKQDHGPVPRQLPETQSGLVQAEAAAVSERLHFNFKQKRIVALRDADLSAFSGEEIAVVDDVIRSLEERNAVEASLLSHSELGWKYAAMREEIPYFTVFLSDAPLTDSDIKRGIELAEAHGFLDQQ